MILAIAVVGIAKTCPMKQGIGFLPQWLFCQSCPERQKPRADRDPFASLEQIPIRLDQRLSNQASEREKTGLRAAPEFLLRRDQDAQIKRIHWDWDFYPLSTAGDDREHR
jgi:hypothetical protein